VGVLATIYREYSIAYLGISASIETEALDADVDSDVLMEKSFEMKDPGDIFDPRMHYLNYPRKNQRA
jgi:hypothetical protein